MKKQKRTATVYFESRGRINFLLNREIEFTTNRGECVAFRNAIHKNFTNAAAVFGNYASCKAYAVENGKEILSATFAAGYFA